MGDEIVAGGRLRDRGQQPMETGAQVRTEGRLAAILAADEEPGLDRLSSNRAEGSRVNRCASCLAAHEHE